jgi:hypothetical protein
MLPKASAAANATTTKLTTMIVSVGMWTSIDLNGDYGAPPALRLTHVKRMVPGER